MAINNFGEIAMTVSYTHLDVYKRQDEPDIGALLKKYQKLCDIPKVEAANPEWSCAISINYWQEGAAPRGMMSAQQVLTEKQDSNHDVYIMPESLFIRVACTAETAKAAFDKNSCELHELFGVIKDSLDENGYVLGTNGAQEIEIYNYCLLYTSRCV